MRVFCICLLILLSQSISAQDKGSITFKVDVVSKPENHLSGWDGKKVAEELVYLNEQMSKKDGE